MCSAQPRVLQKRGASSAAAEAEFWELRGLGSVTAWASWTPIFTKAFGLVSDRKWVPLRKSVRRIYCCRSWCLILSLTKDYVLTPR